MIQQGRLQASQNGAMLASALGARLVATSRPSCYWRARLGETEYNRIYRMVAVRRRVFDPTFALTPAADECWTVQGLRALLLDFSVFFSNSNGIWVEDPASSSSAPFSGLTVPVFDETDAGLAAFQAFLRTSYRWGVGRIQYTSARTIEVINRFPPGSPFATDRDSCGLRLMC